MSRFGYNSTIIRKQKKCVSCGKLSYIFSKNRCEQCARIEDTTKRMEAVSEKFLEDGLPDLIKEADAIVSRYVRLKASDENGECKCFTCDTKLPYQQMQAGHYIGRAHLLLRWDVTRNIRPQCKTCNEFKRGNLAVYAQNLERDYPGLPEILMEEMLLVHKPSREEVKAIILEYSEKVSLLLNKKQ